MKNILFIFLLSACVATHSGYNFEEHTPCEANIFKNTKNDIIDKFGTPTITTPESDKFIYVSRKSYKFLFIKNIAVKQKTCIFTFNKNDVLTEINQK